MIGADLHNPSTVTYRTPTGGKKRKEKHTHTNKKTKKHCNAKADVAGAAEIVSHFYNS